MENKYFRFEIKRKFPFALFTQMGNAVQMYK